MPEASAVLDRRNRHRPGLLPRHTAYTFQASWCDTWRHGRLLLAGDSAHLMPPFAGQGMCSGLRDAANLAWKLDLILDGRADDGILDSYGPERAGQVRHFIEASMALGDVICLPDPVAAAERDRAMQADLAAGVRQPRGTWGSDGVAKSFWGVEEGQEYHDLIEWAGTQSWSNGKVGMAGVSYLAIIQWLTAACQKPSSTPGGTRASCSPRARSKTPSRCATPTRCGTPTGRPKAATGRRSPSRLTWSQATVAAAPGRRVDGSCGRLAE
jgi:hypothetical protein